MVFKYHCQCFPLIILVLYPIFVVSNNFQSTPYWVSEPDDGVPVSDTSPNPRRKVINETTIRIELSDENVYQCNSSNSVGHAFKNFYLNVTATAKIADLPQDIYETVEDKTIALPCRVFNASKSTVKWYQKGNELIDGRFKILDDGGVEIQNPLTTDSSQYECTAIDNSKDSGPENDTVILIVRQRTRIINKQHYYAVKIGHSATLSCEIEADNDLTLIIDWLFNGQLIDIEEDQRMFKSSDNSLTIARTTELDSGTYTCLARSILDEATIDANLTVEDVPNPPRIVSYNCNGLRAFVKWEFMDNNRAPILFFKIHFNVSLFLDVWQSYYNNVGPTFREYNFSMDPGKNYTLWIIASSKIGESFPSEPSETCQSSPDVPSSNPIGVVGEGTIPGYMLISWNPMSPIEHNAPGFFYRVSYREDDYRAEYQSFDIFYWGENQIEMHTGDDFRSFRIKVEAFNDLGQAKVEAREVIGYNGENVPLEAPTNFTLIRIIDGLTAVFKWEPIPPESVQGFLRGYKIQINSTSGTHEKIVFPSPYTMYQRITNLFPFTLNTVRVFAFNGAFDGPPSELITFLTPAAAPGPVGKFKAIPTGSTCFRLTWEKPTEPNGILKGYEITYEEMHDEYHALNAQELKIKDPEQTSVKLCCLKNGTLYRITNRPTNSIGTGYPYYIQEVTNKEAVVPYRPNFTWIQKSGDGWASVKVKLLWFYNQQNGCQFSVQYRKTGVDMWSERIEEESEDVFVVKNLVLEAEYEIRVVAVDGEYSNYSDVQKFKSKNSEVDTTISDYIRKQEHFVSRVRN